MSVYSIWIIWITNVYKMSYINKLALYYIVFYI